MGASGSGRYGRHARGCIFYCSFHNALQTKTRPKAATASDSDAQHSRRCCSAKAERRCILYDTFSEVFSTVVVQQADPSQCSE